MNAVLILRADTGSKNDHPPKLTNVDLNKVLEAVKTFKKLNKTLILKKTIEILNL